MGFAQLVLVAMAAVFGLGVLAVTRSARRPLPVRSPVPVLPLVLCAAAVAISLPVGITLGSLGWRSALPDHGELVLSSPTDPVVAAAWFAAVCTAWAAVPGLAAAGWLLFSRGRSVVAAGVFAAVTWVGATLGMVGGWLLPLPIPEAPLDFAPMLEMTSVVAARAHTMVGLGAAGACLGVGVVAAGSPAGLRGALWATLLLPFLALTVGALTTPPDVVSQVLMAAPMVLCWFLALGTGAALRAGRG